MRAGSGYRERKKNEKRENRDAREKKREERKKKEKQRECNESDPVQRRIIECNGQSANRIFPPWSRPTCMINNGPVLLVINVTPIIVHRIAIMLLRSWGHPVYELAKGVVPR